MTRPKISGFRQVLVTTACQVNKRRKTQIFVPLRIRSGIIRRLLQFIYRILCKWTQGRQASIDDRFTSFPFCDTRLDRQVLVNARSCPLTAAGLRNYT